MGALVCSGERRAGLSADGDADLAGDSVGGFETGREATEHARTGNALWAAPNTISPGYRQLEREAWAESRHGCGVYVRAGVEKPTTPGQILDRQIAGFFRTVRELKLPPQVVRERVSAWLGATEAWTKAMVLPSGESCVSPTHWKANRSVSAMARFWAMASEGSNDETMTAVSIRRRIGNPAERVV